MATWEAPVLGFSLDPARLEARSYRSPRSGRHSASHECEPVVSGRPSMPEGPLRVLKFNCVDGPAIHRLTPVARGVPPLAGLDPGEGRVPPLESIGEISAVPVTPS
jgi:hypothetical protein